MFFSRWLGATYRNRKQAKTVTRSCPLYCEPLEDRTLLATFTVTTDVDNAGGVNPGFLAGTGTLRQALVDANGTVGQDTIDFAIPGGGVRTITPLAALPSLTDVAGVIINGYSQPGSSANTLVNGDDAVLLIQLDGTSAGAGAIGLRITGGNSTVRGLVINRFGFSGIELETNGFNLVEGNFLGTDPTGTLARANRFGIHTSNSNDNVIGGTAPAARNIISGNGTVFPTDDGIELFNSDRNLVQGNYVGTDVTGTLAIGNLFGGIELLGDDNIVGGTAAGAGNLISGNGGAGVFIAHVGPAIAQRNIVQGNRIGTDVTGTAALGNLDGVLFTSNSDDNVIGGTLLAARNIISGNTSDGIQFGFPGGTSSGTNNMIQGNLIGLAIDGTTPLGNAVFGVHVIENSDGQIIGGTVAGAGNVISGNGTAGISIEDTATGNVIQGNRIGTDISGMLDRGNAVHGIQVFTAGNLIGGTVLNAGNLISGNGTSVLLQHNGIELSGAAATGNVIQGNLIGLNATGTAALGNSQNGIHITAGSSDNIIGGPAPGARNVISGNGTVGFNSPDGIEIHTGDRNLVQGNFLGTDVTGTVAIANGFAGVQTQGFDNRVIGNLISGNNGAGVLMSNTAPAGRNVIQGNLIGTDISGTLARGNGRGVWIGAVPADNLIGGTLLSDRNIISGNLLDGVRLDGTGNVVQGNFIGTNVAGSSALGNNIGVNVLGNGNTIGGTAAGAGNVISGNSFDGLELNSNSNVVQGNFIGTNAAGTAGVGGTGGGILVNGNFNIIGGAVAGARNVIGANTFSGIYILAGNGNAVKGNSIGISPAGNAIGNGDDGVHIHIASNNFIGGMGAGDGNVIAFNGDAGIAGHVGGSGNSFLSNAIFGNGGLGIDLGNAGINHGVTPNDSGDPDVGPNGMQNFPVITAVSTGSTIISGFLDSSPNTTFTLQFFANSAADPNEGRSYLGSSVVSTNGSGFANFTATFASLFGTNFITATATSAFNSTSEFSASILFIAAAPTLSSRPVSFSFLVDENVVQALLVTTRQAALEAPASPIAPLFAQAFSLLFPIAAGVIFFPEASGTEATGQISGRLFEDFDGNGVHDQHEPGLAGQVVYLDLNGNGALDIGEPLTRTNERGEYHFNGLNWGSYVVRQLLTESMEQTVPPNDGGNEILLTPATNETNDVNFGALELKRRKRPRPAALLPRETEPALSLSYLDASQQRQIVDLAFEDFELGPPMPRVPIEPAPTPVPEALGGAPRRTEMAAHLLSLAWLHALGASERTRQRFERRHSARFESPTST